LFSGVSREDLLGQLFPMGYGGDKRVVHEKLDWPGPRDRVGRPAQADWPRWVPAVVVPDFCPNCSFSTSFFGQKMLREV
jgi:hypothetical protein